MSLKAFASSFINKFIFLKKAVGNRPFTLLDIGSGNHSASKTLNVFPNCVYHGVDLQKDFHNDVSDYAAMKAFYEMDLTNLNFSSIPNNYFDVINMVHVIEHLFNGDEVIKQLLPKVKSGGYLYVEYPGQKSTTLPSMQGTLNFKDDDTHVRVYSVTELTTLFNQNNCTVLKSGTRRNIFFMLAMPFRIILAWVKGKKLQGNMFWDILGFAEYLWVKKQ
jgi:trans-aconitate methyltransferase